ncbi:hypothetical protein [Timonella sp. A28]|uniref:hypothetical protein n=1 Tax=Timonella sp. A28 TaxID=3442640 RepID=UPI003EBD2152
MTVAPTTPLSSPVPPLGVHLTQDGATVAVFASHASGVDLCLLDRIPESSAEYKDNDDLYMEQRIPLSKNSFGVWHDFVPGIRAGQLYGFRVHGEWRPHTGLRHNPAKLLMDPYARGVVGRLQYGDETYGYVRDDKDSPNPYGAADPRDSRDHVPHAVVVDPPASPEHARPHIPWANTVIYEAHVQGLTQLRHDIPEELRGTYAALSHPELIAHYKKLGITTLELLPIHAFVSEPHLIDKNLTNYWGYNTLSFFAPHEGYATEHAQRQGAAAVHEELKNTIRTLHEHDIEVILDVVYNHTCEGGLDGQHLSSAASTTPCTTYTTVAFPHTTQMSQAAETL